MNIAAARSQTASVPANPHALRVALLGTGTVGRALLDRLNALNVSLPHFELVYLSNSRVAVSRPSGLAAHEACNALGVDGQVAQLADVARVLQGSRPGLIIDATASADVSALHPHWLRRGLHVVTACKLAQGGSLARWRAVQQACAESGARYGDSATVGAGLPLLRTLRALRASGDHILALAGVLSGSLAWLFNGFDGSVPFSHRVLEAHRTGYTEPDPRDDLSGADVRRKLLILARAAGFELDEGDVEIQTLVPESLRTSPREALADALTALDAPLQRRFDEAHGNGAVLRHIARLHADGTASVAVEALPNDDPLAQGGGTDNRIAIWTDRYRERPLVIQGPGAGAEITAAALIEDALAISADLQRLV